MTDKAEDNSRSLLVAARTEALEAEADKSRALAERSRAEATKAKAEARKAVADAARSEVELAKAKRSERAELARDQHYHIYVFDDMVGDSSAEQCYQKLAEWSRTDPKCDIEIIFNSPGGDVVAGMALFDYIQRIRRQGHKVTTTALGMAASMAGILLQAGEVRQMGPEAWLLIHEASFGTRGSYGDVVDTVEWIKRIQERILDIFAKRSAESNSKLATKKLTKNQIKRRWHRKDWWISSDEALKHGFIDAIT